MKKEFKIKTRNLYPPKDGKPYKVSRSGIEMFVECPCCFYLDKKLGIGKPSMPSFQINKAVDTLFKKEFDFHRAKKTAHPLMKHYKIDAVPFQHPNMDEWRDNFKGVQYHHEPTNLLITGAVDDIWLDSKGELIVADYKATAKDSEIDLEDDWKVTYKRQMEVYQWLLRRLGFKVSSVGYFVYANGKTDREAFDGRIEFNITLLPYEGKDEWVEKSIFDIKACLDSNTLPGLLVDCEYCGYAKERALHIIKS